MTSQAANEATQLYQPGVCNIIVKTVGSSAEVVGNVCVFKTTYSQSSFISKSDTVNGQSCVNDANDSNDSSNRNNDDDKSNHN